MKKLVILFASIVLLIFLASVIIFFRYYDDQNGENESGSSSMMLTEYSVIYRYQLKNEGLSLPDTCYTRIIENDNNKLVFRIPEYSCSSCVNREIGLLKDFIQSIGVDKVLIVTGYSDPRDLEVFKNHLPVEINTINIPNIYIPAEEHDKPYYFMIDRSNKIFNMFFPLKINDTLSKIYLESIKERFINHAIKY